MKLADSNTDRYRERCVAESSACRRIVHFPSEQIGSTHIVFSPIRHRHRYKPIRVLALSRNFGWYHGVQLRLVLILGTALFLFSLTSV